jgi:hypothetical protein
MRRYVSLLFLLLSFMLPLELAAFTAAPVVDDFGHTQMSMEEMAGDPSNHHPCCPDGDKLPCHQMQSCHCCNIIGQLSTFFAPSFIFYDALFEPAISEPFIPLFDPSAVWRPPINT